MSHSAKIMLLGEIGVGKSSLAKRLVFDRFESDYKTTIGVDILTCDLTLASGGVVRLMLWDTDGDFGETIFSTVYVLGASGAIIVSDASRPRTLTRMAELAHGFSARFPGRPQRALVNKIDLAAPDLTALAGSGLAAEEVMLASAKTGEGVSALFHDLGEAVVRRAL